MRCCLGLNCTFTICAAVTNCNCYLDVYRADGQLCMCICVSAYIKVTVSREVSRAELANNDSWLRSKLASWLHLLFPVPTGKQDK